MNRLVILFRDERKKEIFARLKNGFCRCLSNFYYCHHVSCRSIQNTLMRHSLPARLPPEIIQKADFGSICVQRSGCEVSRDFIAKQLFRRKKNKSRMNFKWARARLCGHRNTQWMNGIEAEVHDHGTACVLPVNQTFECIHYYVTACELWTVHNLTIGFVRLFCCCLLSSTPSKMRCTFFAHIFFLRATNEHMTTACIVCCDFFFIFAPLI